MTNGRIKLNGTSEITFEAARIHLSNVVFLTVFFHLFIFSFPHTHSPTLVVNKSTAALIRTRDDLQRVIEGL